jgi:hypothetical protein
MTDKQPLVMRDAHGRWLPGSTPNPQGKLPGKNTYIADILREKFCEEMDIEIDGKATPVERRRIMGDALAQLISTGEVHLPNRYGADGTVIPGKVFKFRGDAWLKHLIRVLRYVEPPITQIQVDGDVSGILFDKEIE